MWKVRTRVSWLAKNKRKRKKINLLEVDEETKEKFLSILNEQESDSDSSSEEETEDEVFLKIQKIVDKNAIDKEHFNIVIANLPE